MPMLTRLAVLATADDFILTLRLVHGNTVPLLTAVVGVAFAVVIHNEVILVETVSNNLLVAVFIDFLVEILDVLDLVRVELLLAGLAERPQLRELGALVDFRHAGQA